MTNDYTNTKQWHEDSLQLRLDFLVNSIKRYENHVASLTKLIHEAGYDLDAVRAELERRRKEAA